MDKDAGEFVRRCHVCQQFAPVQTTRKLRPSKPVEPFEVVKLDFIIKLPISALVNSAILTIVEMLSRWATTRDVSTTTTTAALKGLMEEVIYRFEFPLIVITDKCSHFKGLFTSGLKKLNVPHHFTPVYYSQSLGKTERTNGSIKGRSRKYLARKA